jgi:hypothetical protein
MAGERVGAIERRAAPRRAPAQAEPLRCARLRGARELTVANASSAGALVEGTARLLPGTHADVHVLTRHGRVLVRCRIVRAFVCHVTATQVRYRAALAFERPVDVEPSAPG